MKANYNIHRVNDFLLDDDFVNWILNPTEASDTYWNQWLLENPHQLPLVDEAKAIIKNINAVENQFSPNIDMEETWVQIKKSTFDKSKPNKKYYSYTWLKYAAIFILFISTTVFIFYKNSSQSKIVSNQKPDWIVDENNSGKVKTINLSDGSTVNLEPYSTIKYPQIFNEKQREVLLYGEAFFDIQKDSTQPFMVYAQDVITKVLGTSFIIKAFEGDEDVEVTVQTGKVAVYARVASEKKNQKKKYITINANADKPIYILLPNRKIMLTPNQKIVFNKKTKKLVKTITSKPILISRRSEKIKKVVFEDAPVSKVFKAMEEAYGIAIRYDKELIKDCFITTALTDMGMLEKIDMICQALSLHFTEKDGQVFINGEGCN